MVNEDANAKLIRELKEEIQKLRELLKSEGIEVQEGTCGGRCAQVLFVFKSSVRVKRKLTGRTLCAGQIEPGGGFSEEHNKPLDLLTV